MKRNVLLIVGCVLAVLVAGAVAVFVILDREPEPESEKIETVAAPQEMTDAQASYDDEFPTADPAMVGKWRCAENPQWFKVYYDDYDDEGYFWGKEWNEAEDVQEEDLNYHGNGWFRWRKQGKRLTELHTMDATDVPIAKIWSVMHLAAREPNDSLVMANKDRTSIIYHFSREW